MMLTYPSFLAAPVIVSCDMCPGLTENPNAIHAAHRHVNIAPDFRIKQATFRGNAAHLS